MNTYVICYKSVKPSVYNKGTKWETTCNRFLLCECGSKETAEKVLADLTANPEKIAKFGVNPANVASLFISYQEAMY